jgi:membrane peptidoglycan carboxypeptidase
VFAGLDKITGRIISFDVAVNETVQFGALQVTPRACYSRPPTETPNTDAFVEVDEVTLQGEIKRIFTGWMFAASPGLHAVEHPIYDVWITDCKGGQAPTVADAPEAKPGARQPQQQQSPQSPQQQQQRRPPQTAQQPPTGQQPPTAQRTQPPPPPPPTAQRAPQQQQPPSLFPFPFLR